MITEYEIIPRGRSGMGNQEISLTTRVARGENGYKSVGKVRKNTFGDMLYVFDIDGRHVEIDEPFLGNVKVEIMGRDESEIESVKDIVQGALAPKGLELQIKKPFFK